MTDQMLPEYEQIVARLFEVAQLMSDLKFKGDPSKTLAIRQQIQSVSIQLGGIAKGLDPFKEPQMIFDPTDPSTAGRIIALTLTAQTKYKLGALPQFYGSGVYAIYYRGPFPAYSPVSGTDHPLYVGKADPEDLLAKDAVNQGKKIYARLHEHAKNIGKAQNLDLNDFDCRFIVVQTGFQKSAEDFLIEFFKPIWNSDTKLCFGLGKHGDSSKTRANKRSPWDTLHPGRTWAVDSENDQKKPEVILEELSRFFANNHVYVTTHEIMDRILADLDQSPE